jgi:hypothetical protein
LSDSKEFPESPYLTVQRQLQLQSSVKQIDEIVLSYPRKDGAEWGSLGLYRLGPRPGKHEQRYFLRGFVPWFETTDNFLPGLRTPGLFTRLTFSFRQPPRFTRKALPAIETAAAQAAAGRLERCVLALVAADPVFTKAAGPDRRLWIRIDLDEPEKSTIGLASNQGFNWRGACLASDWLGPAQAWMDGVKSFYYLSHLPEMSAHERLGHLSAGGALIEGLTRVEPHRPTPP